MAITYSWSVKNLERQAADDVVRVIHYWIFASDDQFESSAYGSVEVFPGAEEDFIPYSELTPEIVIEWVKQKLGEDKVQQIEAELAKRIEIQHSPPVIAGVPWES